MMRAAVLALVLAPLARGFYLPGVAPQDFEPGAPVKLKVNKLTSHKTQLPYDYYNFAFCRPGRLQAANENLGEFLTGDRIENSPYTIYMIENQFCKVLCQVELGGHAAHNFRESIEDMYHHNWIVDNLPAASEVYSDQFITTSYSEGFPLGYKENGKYYLYNHVVIKLNFHKVSERHFRVVGFIVEPYSVKHKFKDSGSAWNGEDPASVPPLSTCSVDRKMEYMDAAQRAPQEVVASEKMLYTYDVVWTASAVKWASRWDIYLSMDNAVPNRVHWFSIINSLLIVLFLTVMIAMILVRNLYRDIRRYNAINREEDQEDTGWKLVHTDVFRPPAEFRMLFCVFVGTGAQIITCALLTVLFASVGFLSPASRGSLMVALLLLYALMGSVSGYVSARLFKTFKGKTWQRCTSLTAFLFPGICFLIFLTLNIMMSSYHSTGAVPFTSMVSLVGLWLFVAVPLVFLGAFIGYRRDPIEFPVRFSVTPRPIPEQPWYLGTGFLVMMGGILPFGACFVEVFFIMSSLWLGQYYYVFGFLLVVLIILLVTCAETAIVFCYFQLCNEDYRWWWRSFIVPGSTGLYVLLYSVLYFARLEANLTVTYFLYFSYMVLISGGVALITGTAGFVACLWFTSKIYGALKVE